MEILATPGRTVYGRLNTSHGGGICCHLVHSLLGGGVEGGI